MLRVALVLVLLTTHVGAERRKNALPGTTVRRRGGSDRPDHTKRIMLSIGASGGASTGIEESLRVFVHDRVTLGLRLRTAWERTRLESELGVSLWAHEPARSWRHLRYDVVGTIGVATSTMPVAGIAFRVHPRGLDVLDAVAGEIGARGSEEGIEIGVGLIMMWPPPRRTMRSCSGGVAWR